jgi:hypothetical protein
MAGTGRIFLLRMITAPKTKRETPMMMRKIALSLMMLVLEIGAKISIKGKEAIKIAGGFGEKKIRIPSTYK